MKLGEIMTLVHSLVSVMYEGDLAGDKMIAGS
jgi:hypothetical protein